MSCCLLVVSDHPPSLSSHLYRRHTVRHNGRPSYVIRIAAPFIQIYLVGVFYTRGEFYFEIPKTLIFQSCSITSDEATQMGILKVQMPELLKLHYASFWYQMSLAILFSLSERLALYRGWARTLVYKPANACSFQLLSCLDHGKGSWIQIRCNPPVTPRF